MTATRAAITGWGRTLPERVVTNADFEARVDTNDAWIVERTGIRERRVVGTDETTATMAADAAAAALKKATLVPDDIDLFITATSTGDTLIPHTGSWIQDRLGLRCGSFDLGAGCAGFVYALVMGSSLVQTGAARHLLVIGSETMSAVIDPQDRSTVVLFGDGAAALVLSATESDEPLGVESFDLGCDGAAAALLVMPAGGSRCPASRSTVDARDHYLKMAGREVFRRAVRAVVDSATHALDRAQIGAGDIDWFVPHQANVRIIEAVANRLGIPMDRTIVNIDRYGNTSAASIPIAISEAADDGRIQPGQRLLISGFGAGMTWASAVARWGTR